jgi:hypothetical protein
MSVLIKGRLLVPISPAERNNSARNKRMRCLPDAFTTSEVKIH